VNSALEALQTLLLEGVKLSGTGSYERDRPRNAAIPALLEAREGLGEYVKEHPGSADAWRLLSHAHECCRDYLSAQTCLERAMELSGRQRSDLKKWAQLREYVAEVRAKRRGR
jgi:hypothetical protein